MESRQIVPWPDRDDWERIMAWPQRAWSQMMRDVPSIEVADEGDALIVRVEVPGVDPNELDVELTPQQLMVRGEIRQSTQGGDQGMYHSERRYGRFQRTIPLPAAVDTEAAEATYRHGLLEVRLPHGGAGHRKLTVRTGDETPRH